MNDNEISDNAQFRLATDLGKLLLNRKLTCSVAESCTGGMIGAVITSVAGSSEWFQGGIIAYSNDIKMRLLNVPPEVLAEKGAVSEETVIAMASGAARICGADCAVAVSGIAGPGGGTVEKPAGLVYVGTFFQGAPVVFRHVFPGDRATVRRAAATAALHYLIARFDDVLS
jgi:PncC family amidohydrolase